MNINDPRSIRINLIQNDNIAVGISILNMSKFIEIFLKGTLAKKKKRIYNLRERKLRI